MLIRAMSRSAQPARGLSVVELMVGVAVGMFIIGGAVKLVVDGLSSNRQLLIETRLNQDLRAAADIVARDLRRAGYWANSASGVTWPATTNPYRTVALAPYYASSQASYVYEGTGFTGFQVNASGVLQGRLGGSWQDLTDRNTVNVPSGGFSIVPNVQSVSLGANCTPVCNSGTPGCPVLNVRRYDITIQGQAVSNGTVLTNVTREIRESVRVRNDEIPNPSCP